MSDNISDRTYKQGQIWLVRRQDLRQTLETRRYSLPNFWSGEFKGRLTAVDTLGL